MHHVSFLISMFFLWFALSLLGRIGMQKVRGPYDGGCHAISGWGRTGNEKIRPRTNRSGAADKALRAAGSSIID